jgi:hypothetical protein
MASEKKDLKSEQLDFSSMTNQDIANRYPELKIADETEKYQGMTEIVISTGQLKISKPKLKEPTLEEDPQYWQDLFNALM